MIIVKVTVEFEKVLEKLKKSVDTDKLCEQLDHFISLLAEQSEGKQ